MTPEQLVQLWKGVGLVNALRYFTPPSWRMLEWTETATALETTAHLKSAYILVGAFILSTVFAIPKVTTTTQAISVFKRTLPTMVLMNCVTFYVYPTVQNTAGKMNALGCLLFNLGALFYLSNP